MTPQDQPPRDATDPSGGPRARVVDRHDETIGVQADPTPPLGRGGIEVELTDTLKRLLEIDEDRVAVPAAWVAGVRRDEIRLDLSVEDPAFRSRVRDPSASRSR